MNEAYSHRIITLEILRERERVKREKNMQKIVLFIEPNNFAFHTPVRMGDLFMNRFAIEEKDSSEILKIFELVGPKMRINEDNEDKGMDHFIVPRD